MITLHLPLTAETRHLIGADEIAQMKRGAYLVNTARGGLVDEAALVGALESGHLAAAALDVFETEPIPAGHPLTRLEKRRADTAHLGRDARRAANKNARTVFQRAALLS